jgi:hypothetical protein
MQVKVIDITCRAFFYNRYISANIPETDQVKSNICNTIGEMYPGGVADTSCRTFSGMVLRALGRASGIVSEAFGFFIL